MLLHSEIIIELRKQKQILQGLRVAQAAVTERWPSRKIARKWPFFLGQKKITQKKYFFLHISSSYAKILGETNFPEVGEK